MATITGTEGNDNLTSSDEPWGDTIDALGGDDTITVDIPFNEFGTAGIFVDGGDGFDILYFSAVSFGGTSEADSIFGQDTRRERGTVSWQNIERFVLEIGRPGGTGSNFVAGPSLKLGAAEDWLTINNNLNVPIHISTGDGADRIILRGWQVGTDIDLGAGNDFVDFSEADPTGMGPVLPVFIVRGGEGNDKIIGTTARDELYGGNGNDLLDSFGGDGRGNLLVGGTGNDIYYAHSGDTIVEQADEGWDGLYARTSFGLAAGVSIEELGTADHLGTEGLTLVGNELNNSIIGNYGNNALYGGSGDDSLRGLVGNDVMDGQGGTDYLIGGLGDDIYFVDGLDTAEELAGEGYDSVYASTSYTLNTSSEIEMLATTDYQSTIALSLSGNQLNNYIVGNNGNNVIDGRTGDDSLLGLAGNDLMIGGAGIDYMIGGTGDDTYYVDVGDTVDERANEGSDSVYAANSYVLTADSSVELLATLDYQSNVALNLTGNDFGQSIIGSLGANNLLGLGGNDSINGLDGADRIDGGAGQDYLQGGAGADTFLFTAAGHSLHGAADAIADFVSGTDKIDLAALDANSLTATDDPFTFIGAGAFNGQAGQLRVAGSGGVWQVYGDTNGDLVADFQITVYGSAPIQADFVF